METIPVSFIEQSMSQIWTWTQTLVYSVAGLALVLVLTLFWRTARAGGDAKALLLRMVSHAAPALAAWLYLVAGILAFMGFALLTAVLSEFMEIDTMMGARLSLPALLIGGSLYLLIAPAIVGRISRAISRRCADALCTRRITA